jgi:hypothetical protein
LDDPSSFKCRKCDPTCEENFSNMLGHIQEFIREEQNGMKTMNIRHDHPFLNNKATGDFSDACGCPIKLMCQVFFIIYYIILSFYYYYYYYYL